MSGNKPPQRDEFENVNLERGVTSDPALSSWASGSAETESGGSLPQQAVAAALAAGLLASSQGTYPATAAGAVQAYRDVLAELGKDGLP